MHQRWLSGLALPLRFYTKMITVDFGTRCAIFRFRPGLVYRVTVPRASTAEVIQTVHNWSTADFRPEIVSDAAMGIVWISLRSMTWQLSGSQN